MSATRFRAALANPDDDAALRGLLKQTPMEGMIRVVFEREPSFWNAARLAGPLHQVIVGRDTLQNQLVGMGARSVASCFVNGQTQAVGYLHDLRLAPGYRNATLLARGYRFLRELHKDGAADIYYTVIFSDNLRALGTIAQGRAGLPTYHDWGLIHSPAITIGRTRRELPADATICGGTTKLLPAIIDCLNRNNRRKEFAPLHAMEDFLPGGRWLGMSPEKFYVAVRSGQVVGVMAPWDQRDFKQTRVVGYGQPLKLLRPLLNCLSPLTGTSRLPRSGDLLNYFYAAFVAVDDDNLEVFRSLLRRLYNDGVGSACSYIIIGLHERDPLLAALEDYRFTPFYGRLFRVSFDDPNGGVPMPHRAIPYVEVGAL